MRIVLHEQARADILRGIEFYESRSLGLGAYFETTVVAAIDTLRFMPRLHPVRRGYHRMLVHRFPFAVYYKVAGERVVVLAVLDTRMNPATVDARLKGADV